MEIRCCLCGKKGNRFNTTVLQEPFQNERLCSECYGVTQKLEEIVNGAIFPDKNIVEYRDYILNNLHNSKDLNPKLKESYILMLSKVDKILDQQLETTKKKEEEEQLKNKRKESFMVTTGYDFQGYNIIKYIDLVSCEYVIGTGLFSEFTASFSDTFGTSSNSFSNKIAKAKQQVLEEMKNQSVEIGANALIGIDFDILTFNNNMIAVSGNGTAVLAERN